MYILYSTLPNIYCYQNSFKYIIWAIWSESRFEEKNKKVRVSDAGLAITCLMQVPNFVVLQNEHSNLTLHGVHLWPNFSLIYMYIYRIWTCHLCISLTEQFAEARRDNGQRGNVLKYVCKLLTCQVGRRMCQRQYLWSREESII